MCKKTAPGEYRKTRVHIKHICFQAVTQIKIDLHIIQFFEIQTALKLTEYQAE